MCNVTIFVNTIVSVIDIFLCPVRQRRHLIIEPAEQGLEAVRAGDLRLLGLRQGLIGIIGRLNRVIGRHGSIAVHVGQGLRVRQGVDPRLHSGHRRVRGLRNVRLRRPRGGGQERQAQSQGEEQAEYSFLHQIASI